MGFNDNLDRFMGQPVVDWTGDAGIDFAASAVRLRLDYDEADEGVTIAEKLSALLEADGIDGLRSLVVGAWSPVDTEANPADVLDALIAARPKLPRLRNLFVGDVTYEECEVSWLQQTDYAALLAAYDALEHLTVRGTENLTFGARRHDTLKELAVQGGGLPGAVLREILDAKLPQLERLELYLGDSGYGGDVTPADLAPLLGGGLFPALRHLGLKDSEIADDVAAAVSVAPLLGRIDTLDLSLGTLGDKGAQALLDSPAVRRLKKLDLHFHYLSDGMMDRLRRLGIDVDLSDRQEAEEYGGETHRYVAVSE